ncbi:hypothetical protein FRC12_000454 [Ceratobasidium sp. 428]|nr:hypothetical protein FRC12_000454 [Ceratobasidium sp. 428]
MLELKNNKLTESTAELAQHLHRVVQFVAQFGELMKVAITHAKDTPDSDTNRSFGWRFIPCERYKAMQGLCRAIADVQRYNDN